MSNCPKLFNMRDNFQIRKEINRIKLIKSKFLNKLKPSRNHKILQKTILLKIKIQNRLKMFKNQKNSKLHLIPNRLKMTKLKLHSKIKTNKIQAIFLIIDPFHKIFLNEKI